MHKYELVQNILQKSSVNDNFNPRPFHEVTKLTVVVDGSNESLQDHDEDFYPYLQKGLP